MVNQSGYNLGAVRGTLDGSPLDAAFTYDPIAPGAVAEDSYGTEGWAITNRAWMSTVAFSTLSSHRLRPLNPKTGGEIESVGPGDHVRVELRAALNQDWQRTEKGWVEVSVNGMDPERIVVTETGPNTGDFTGEFRAEAREGDEITMSYGYLASRKSTRLLIRR